jgi:rhamnose utilization protein RhaD (predicted bifunctional aldolase and dehydrogenase)
LSDEEIDRKLLAARTDSSAQKPSVESIFHAYLLSLPGVNFIGHTHPVAVGQVLCSKYGRLFARRRLFPDQVVCCGPESVYVPYTDPGLKLAQAIRLAVTAFAGRPSPPRVILLENHGFIALGATAEAVLATTLMGNKAAEIFVGAAALGAGRPRFLSRAEVDRVAGRRDEHHRQRQLGLLTSSR